MTDTDVLAERYGRTRERRRRDRVTLAAGAAAVALVVIGWIVWAGATNPASTIDTQGLGFRVHDETRFDFKYQVSAPAGSEVSCALQVLNSSKATVGWKVVELPPSDEHTRVFTEPIRTTELGVSGLIYRCWTP